jgi:hypothetical protein
VMGLGSGRGRGAAIPISGMNAGQVVAADSMLRLLGLSIKARLMITGK